MKAYIPGRYGRANSTDHAGLYLGVKTLPKTAMAERQINGVTVYVRPYVKAAHGRKTCTHRIMAICACGRHVPTGRLHQHVCD